MEQSRLSSFYEALINIAIGYIINFFANIVILPVFFDIRIDLWQFFIVGVPYTLISVVRQYTIRRWFNARIHNIAIRLANGNETTK